MKNNVCQTIATQTNNSSIFHESTKSTIANPEHDLKDKASPTLVILKRLRHYASIRNGETTQSLSGSSCDLYGQKKHSNQVAFKSLKHGKNKDAQEFVRRMLVDGILPLKTVSRLGGLSLVTVKELAAQITRKS